MNLHFRLPRFPVSLLVVAATLAFALPVAAQSPYDLFVKDFDQAMKFNNADGVQKAVRDRPSDAINHFVALVVGHRRSEDQERFKPALDALKKSFKAAFEVDTLERVERYYMNVDADRINLLYKAEENRTKLFDESVKLKQSGDRKGVLELVEQGLALGRHTEELGQKLIAADVYSTLAVMMNQIPNHTTQDTKDTMDFVKMFLAQRDGWAWNKDTTYLQWKNWVAAKTVEIGEEEKKAELRRKAGLDDSAEGIGKLVDTREKAEISKLTFKPLKEPAEDSCFVAGSVPMNWLSLRLEKDPVKAEYFKKRDLFFKRTSSTKLGLMLTNAPGAPVMEAEAGAKIKPTLVYLDTEKQDPYSLAIFIGSETQPFASTVSNVYPTPEAMTIYYRSMSSWVGEINGEEVTFYDDNCDGLLFTEDPMAYGYKTRLTGLGPKEEVPVPVYDSMKIGKKGDVVPFSGAAKIGDRWFQLVKADGGKAVEARPLHPTQLELGTVTMKWSGNRNVKPQLLIIRGRDNLQALAFNIADGKPVEVPAGKYRIDYGRSTKGKGNQAQMVHIFKGESATIAVEKGKNTEVALGAPFKYHFKKEGDENVVKLNSLFFQIRGAAGEVYGKIQGPIPAPDVVVAKTTSGRGAKVVGRYVPINSPELLNAAADTLGALIEKEVRGMGINVGYFPVVKGDRSASTVLTFKVPFTGALVGLQVKRHKLFGKIEPDWK